MPEVLPPVDAVLAVLVLPVPPDFANPPVAPEEFAVVVDELPLNDEVLPEEDSLPLDDAVLSEELPEEVVPDDAVLPDEDPESPELEKDEPPPPLANGPVPVPPVLATDELTVRFCTALWIDGVEVIS